MNQFQIQFEIDGIYQKNSPFLTKLIDNIPLIETKSKSRIIATTEFAHLIPGHHRAVGKNGVSYIDDFESSRTSLDIKNMGHGNFQVILLMEVKIQLLNFQKQNFLAFMRI